jgi:thiol-disulfide isomerase/thioredoxin
MTGVGLREKSNGATWMILMFTSNHCVLCNMVKGMLQQDESDLADVAEIYEVNVEKHPLIAEAYGIMVVPALVAGCKALYGVPSESELRSFILQAAVGGLSLGAGDDSWPPLGAMHHCSPRKRESSVRLHIEKPEHIAAGPTHTHQIPGKARRTERLSDEKEPPNPTLEH